MRLRFCARWRTLRKRFFGKRIDKKSFLSFCSECQFNLTLESLWKMSAIKFVSQSWVSRDSDSPIKETPKCVKYRKTPLVSFLLWQKLSASAALYYLPCQILQKVMNILERIESWTEKVKAKNVATLSILVATTFFIHLSKKVVSDGIFKSAAETMEKKYCRKSVNFCRTFAVIVLTLFPLTTFWNLEGLWRGQRHCCRNSCKRKNVRS